MRKRGGEGGGRGTRVLLANLILLLGQLVHCEATLREQG